MSLANNDRFTAITASGGQTVFTPDYPLFAASEIVVRYTPIATGVEATLTLGVDYTITEGTPGVYPTTFTVTKTVAALVNDIMEIEGERPVRSTAAFSLAGEFTSTEVNYLFDVAAAERQELRADVNTLLTSSAPIDGVGVATYIPIWTDTNTLASSATYQTGSGAASVTTHEGSLVINAGLRLNSSASIARSGANITITQANFGVLITGGTGNLDEIIGGVDAQALLIQPFSGTITIRHNIAPVSGGMRIYTRDGTNVALDTNENALLFRGTSGWVLTTPANNSASGSIPVVAIAPGTNGQVIATVGGVAAWTTILGLDAQDGSAAAPSFGFISEVSPNGMGMYRVANDTIGFSTNGALRVSIDATGDIEQTPDVDSTNIFGRVRMDSRVSDVAFISHYDMAAAGEYGFGQTAVGATAINAPTGQTVAIGINAVAVATFNATTLTMPITITQNSDVDTTNIFGRVRMDSRVTDIMFLSHFDMSAAGQYAVGQTAAGRTAINSATGQTVGIGINAVDVAAFSATTLTMPITITQNADADTANVFGRVRMDSRTTDMAHFSHYDFTAVTDYALVQTSAGAVNVNAPVGQNVAISLGGAGHTTFAAAVITMTTNITQSADADRTNIFGRARIDQRTTDIAHFSHYDMSAATDYALAQTAAGATVVNCLTGQGVSIAINNSAIVTFGATNVISAVPDTDASVILGRARFGALVADYTYFAHYDNLSTTNFALAQGASGDTYLNAASGQSLAFRINGTTKMTVTGTTATFGTASTDTFTLTSRLLVRSVTDAGPMTATAGSQREIVYNTSNSTFYGCTVTHASAATWVAFN